MELRIALAGNPNSGKTTLFNALTGSNQYVGNWPGVTVEKKEGRLKKQQDVTICDLPGIYSLSPYTLEEVVARNYLLDTRPDAILNIVDGTNLERNLYLTTQLLELGIPVVVAVNMMDQIRKNGDKINTKELSRELGVPVVEISAIKREGLEEAVAAVIRAASKQNTDQWLKDAGCAEGSMHRHPFSGPVEHVIAHIEEAAARSLPETQQRFYAVKLFERDNKVPERLNLDETVLEHIEQDIVRTEKELDDDSESIITNERYIWIGKMMESCYRKKSTGTGSLSDKIDRVVTNRFLGLPIFAVVMFLVYYISMVSIGQLSTDWMNDGVFGDGFHLFGIGNAAYEEAAESYADTDSIIDGFLAEYGTEDMALALDAESDDYTEEGAIRALGELVEKTPEDASVTYTIADEETLELTEYPGTTKKQLIEAVEQYENMSYKFAVGAPDPAEYGVWVPGIPVLVSQGLERLGAADWLSGLINDGIVAGVGAVLGFVPQMLVLFLLLAMLEACGYMARIAFVLDRVFRKFGLSGKSFIPMLIGTGCGVPGIMASRTIENDRDRRMTIMTTTFIPCSAKIPFIGMIAGALFGGSAWVSTSAYFIGMASVIFSGILLKRTKMFAGEPAPFVMELPAYRLPGLKNVLSSMWERGWSFIKKAGTIILLSTIVIWFTSFFGFVDGSFRMLGEEEISHSLLAFAGRLISWIFRPLGWGTWEAAVASITGLVAKENIVGTMGILYGASGNVYRTLQGVFSGVSAYSFLVFNLLCAPCFAAIGAIKREMNSAKWTWFAIGYQTIFAYAVALLVFQIGRMFV